MQILKDLCGFKICIQMYIYAYIEIHILICIIFFNRSLSFKNATENKGKITSDFRYCFKKKHFLSRDEFFSKCRKWTPYESWFIYIIFFCTIYLSVVYFFIFPLYSFSFAFFSLSTNISIFFLSANFEIENNQTLAENTK